jgi:Bacterial Ig-like domain (group 2)
MVLSLVILAWSGCGGGMSVGGSSSTPTSNGMTVMPPSATLRAGDSTQFSATVTGNMNQTVTWSVNGVSAGNATVGTIDATGKYNAPSSLPSPNSVTIKATSVADKSLSATSSVSLQNPIPVLQTLSPTFLPVGNFSLNVGGAGFVSGSKVMFGGTALATTYVGPTQLTATGAATSAQVGTVKITVENPDPGKISSVASMNVQVGAAGKVSVLVIPATAQITAGSTFQYRTAVDGAGANTAVKWAINGIPNGNTTVGTISAGGIYQAPATVPTPNTIRVQATSLADTTATSTGTATLTNPAPVVTLVLPTAIPRG